MEYEMLQYALTGLMKSVCRYNGTGYFHKFAEKYVRGELFRGITERIVMQPWKHGELYSKNHTYQNVVSLVSVEEEWRYDKTRKRGADVLEMYKANITGKPHWIEKHALVEQIKRIVEEMVPEQQRMFFYRYDRQTLEPIRTVYYASKLMGFSDETYRKKMNVVHEYIRYQLKKNILHI
jgi:DNA-directed RNA polymerase specialized sigma subunit